MKNEKFVDVLVEYNLGNVSAYSKPFVLTVVNDANELTDVANRGFSLSYTQQLCRS